jgi:hypothetical protein
MPAIGEGHQVMAGRGVDDAVGAGSGQVVNGAWQCCGRPDQAASGVGDDLHIHAVPFVLDASIYVKQPRAAAETGSGLSKR